MLARLARRRRAPLVPDARRLLSSCSSSTQDAVRELLRTTAQPVTVITAASPSPDAAQFHGATLSSFTSVSMSPWPVIAFSIRTPSRMATALNHQSGSRDPHMVLNILSASQSHHAVRFSRPDLHPSPFAGISTHLTTEGIPILSGCLGALSCVLLKSILLDRDSLHSLGVPDTALDSNEQGLTPTLEPSSELFLARVVRVEAPTYSTEASPESVLPLVYHHRQYVTVHNPERPQDR
ncbi:hypothetical protein BOTBODRAFT_103312 [Botryobasidium botryosum FD-172 SS1]|uniref:Flavin reductase like domain-containing protein n=1 Tax=Botryobasidium botryosum (strain FD-172 SS1) TaxID=930990 RepID=A0A067MTR7_BOTB1|nr:hypothetical protein BOTBODRAFT_103312 [Botryobasidium botryosum FD-172 SS1]